MEGLKFQKKCNEWRLSGIELRHSSSIYISIHRIKRYILEKEEGNLKKLRS
jgi:hypothetical protein